MSKSPYRWAKKLPKFIRWGVYSSGFLFLQTRLESATSTWNINTSGAWNNNANWSPPPFPNNINDVANFANGNGLNFPRTVTLGQDITIGTLNFASPLGNSYFIAGSNNLTFQVSSGSAAITSTSGPNQTISCPVILNSPVVIAPAGSGMMAISGAISGTGSLTKQGSQSLTLSGINSYSSTILNGGILSVSSDANLGQAAGGITFATSSTLASTASFSTNRNISLNPGVNANFSPSLGTSLTLNGIISGNANISFMNGTLVPTNTSNSFTGQIIFNNSGILQISDPAQLGNATQLRFQGGSFSTLHTTQNMTITQPLLLASGMGGAHVNSDTGTTLTLTGNISNNPGNTATFEIRDGGGVVALRGDNSNYVGGMFITGTPIPLTLPTLNVIQDNNFGSPSSPVRMQGGIVQFSGNVISPSTRTFNVVSLSSEPPTFIADAGTSSVIQGVVQEISLGGQILLKGPGSLALTNPANLFQSGFLVNTSGTLQVQSNGSLGVDVAGNDITLDSGSLEFLQAGGGIHSVNRQLLLNGTGPGSLILDDGTASTWDGFIQGTRNLTIAKPALALGTGTLSLTADNTGSYTGNITIQDVTLQISNSNNLGSGTNLTLNQGTLELLTSVTIPNTLPITLTNSGSFLTDSGVSTLNSVISGNGTLIKKGSATLLLGNAGNTYLGGTEIDNGILQITTDGNLGNVAGGVTFAGGTLEFLNNVTIPSTRLLTYTTNGTIQVDGGTSTIAGPSTGPGSLIKTGPGTLVLLGTNNYTGGTFINTGILALSGSGQLSPVGAVDVIGTFDITASTIPQTIGDLLGSGLVDLGVNTLTAGTSNSTLFSGVIQGTGGFTKAGSGTLTLTGNNTYSGGTLINAGTLALSGTGTLLSTGSVNANGTFDISGSTINQTIGDLSGSGFVQLGANTLTEGTSNSTLFSGAIQGTGALVKVGSGTLTLAGTNTYSGGTFINAGTVALSGTGSLSSTGAVDVVGTFDITASTIPQTIGDLLGSGLVNLGANTLTAGTSNSTLFSGVIQGTGGFTKAGSGTLTFTGNNTYSGGTSINAGTLALSGTGTLFSTGSVNANGTFDISGSTINQTIGDLSGSGFVQLGANTLTEGTSNSTLFSGAIQGTGALIKVGSGTLTLAGTNIYTGGTFINAGTLALSGTGSLSSVGAVDVLGTFDLSGSTIAQTIGDLTGSGLVQLGVNRLTEGTSNSTLFSGVIQGPGSFAKDGSGTLTLTGNNTYTGGTLINSGTLALSGTGQLSPTGAVDVLGTFDITASTIPQTIGDLLGSGLVNLGTNSLTAGTSNSTTFSGVIQGTGGFTKAGSGTLTFTGNNTYSGGTLINAGTLALSGTGQLLSTAPVNVLGTFDISGSIIPQTIGDLSGSGFVQLGANMLTEGTSNSTLFSGVIQGAGSLAKAGSGTLTLTGNNTYSGGTFINAGTVALSGSGKLSPVGAVNVIGTFDITASTIPQTIGDLLGTGLVNLGATTLTAGTSNSTTFAGVIQGTGGFTKAGSGTLTLTGNNTYSGGTLINAGTLALSGTGQLLPTGSVNVNGTFDISGSTIAQTIGDLSGTGFVQLGANTLTEGTSNSTLFSGTIQGTGAIVKVGSGTLTLTGANTYTGGTFINAGTVALSGTGSLSSVGAVDVLGTFDLSGSTIAQTIGDLTGSGFVILGVNKLTAGTSNSTLFSGVIQGPGSFVKTGSGTLTLTGNNIYTGGTLINSGTLALSGTGQLSPTGAVDVLGTFDISGSAVNQTIGNLSGSGIVNLGANSLTTGVSGFSIFSGAIQGTGGFTKAGSGTLALIGPNTYSGGTQITNGTLQIQSDNNLGNPSGGITFAGSGGTLEFLNGLTLASTRLITLSSPAVLQADSGTSSFDGVITGPATLTKQGGGTLVLGGVSSYTGNTEVAQGPLIVNGDISSSMLTTVDGGALLGGIGTLNAVSVFGTVAPGNPLGTLHADEFTFQTGSTYQVEIINTAADQIAATNTINILPGSTLHLIPQNVQLTSYVIGTAGGGVTGGFSTVVNEFPRYDFTVLYELNDIILQVQTNSFGGFFGPGNLRNIAVCFDAMIGPTLSSGLGDVLNLSMGPNVAHILEVLNSLSTSELWEAFNQFDPSLYGSLNIAELDTSAGLLELYSSHMSLYRSSAMASCAREAEGCGKLCDTTWQIWLTPFAMKDHREKSGVLRASSGYKNSTYGIASGIDFQCVKDVFTTLGFSYSNSHMNWKTSPKTTAAYNSYSGIVGTSFVNSCISLEACFAGTYHTVNANRNIYIEGSPLLLTPVDPIDYSLRNQNQAYSLASSLSATYNIYSTRATKGRFFTLWPYMNVDYLFAHQYGYFEKGGAALNMQMDARNTDLLISEGGFGISAVKDACHFLFYADASLGYAKECRFQGHTMMANFKGNPGCQIALKGLFPRNEFLVPRLDVGVQSPCKNLSFFFSYKGAFGHSFKENMVSIELKAGF